MPTAASMIGQEHQITIYVAKHCTTCDYSYQVAEEIRRKFPHVQVRIVDLEQTTEVIPEIVFATPTYLLDGRVWSLGNPSPAHVEQTLSPLTRKRNGKVDR
ncbi:MAG: hypothetical protein DCC55_07490 [Chloroflexi bacterium]|nr:MAG: hypothetical protein DCC55_07490 [Chloroflexota bacterium]